MHGINLLNQALKDCEGKRVLDLGVGAGGHAKAFIAHGAEVAGVDVRESPHTHPKYTHTQLAIELLEPAEDAEPFDIVWSCHTLEHLPNPQMALIQIKKFLKEDGWLYIAVPSASQDRLHVGHLSLWSPALLVYNLICAGYDCSDALWYTSNQTIGLCMQRKDIEDMTWRTGLPNEAAAANQYSPVTLKNEHGAWWANNWPVETMGRVIDPPMVTAGVERTNLPPQVQLCFGPNPKLREDYERTEWL